MTGSGPVLDKHNVLERLDQRHSVVLELGCGERKRLPDSIGIDALDYPAADIVGDVFDALARFPDGSADAVHSHHFVEHISDLDRLLAEMTRVLKSGGLLEIVVPHFSNPYFYSDPTHRQFFGLYTFSYLARDPLFRRKVPTYQREFKLTLESVNLRFKSSPPFYGRHAFKLFVGKLVNLSNYTREFYEENLTYLVPCYEAQYVLRRQD